MFMMVMMPLAVMLVVLVLIIRMLMLMVLILMRVAVFGSKRRRVMRLQSLSTMITVLGRMVGSSGVNVKFYAGNSCTSLTLEMQVAIAEVQF